MDWSICPDVESRPDVVSSAWVVKDTRVQADAVIENFDDGFSAEEIVTDIFEGLPLDRIRRVIAFARQQLAYSA